MKIFNVFWKIIIVILGIVIIFLIVTEADRRYEARYEAFLDCNISQTQEVCSELFGGK